jgi:hypothetical protein
MTTIFMGYPPFHLSREIGGVRRMARVLAALPKGEE